MRSKPTKPQNTQFRTIWAFKAFDAGEDGAIRAEMTLDGEFSDAQYWDNDITSKTFREELAALGNIDVLTLKVNSLGGDLWSAMAIRNELASHPAHKIGVVQGIAASAATLPLTACDEVRMGTGSMMLIHCSSDFAFGLMNADAHGKAAEDLTAIDGAIVACYAEFTGKTEDEIRAQMKSEAYMSAQECVDFGLADEIIPGEPEETEQTGATQDPNDPDLWNIAGQKFNFKGITIRPVAMLTQATTTPVRGAKAVGKTPRAAAGVPAAAPVNRQQILADERKRVARLQAFNVIPGAQDIIQQAIDSDEDPSATAEKILLTCAEKISVRVRHSQRFLDSQQSGVNQVPANVAMPDGKHAQKSAQRSGIVNITKEFLNSIGRAKVEDE